MQVSRTQVLAYRVAAQGLHRDAGKIDELAVLDIGVQEAMGSPAALAFAPRLPRRFDLAPDAIPVGPEHDLALVWSLRGAPYVHRRGELDRLAAALWPLSEADAAVRLNETGPSVQRAGIAALEQYRIAVQQMRAAVTKPIAKGAASTAVSKRLPPVMLRDCRACKARHISDSAMRTALVPAGLELEPGTSPPVLLRRRAAKLPKRADLGALAELARRYLALLGPATVADVAGYLEARRADVEQALAGKLAGLTEVRIDGRTALIPDERLALLRRPPQPDPVRLLGPFDPYLQARDRALLVPDTAVQKALWPVLGRPGAVLLDGEIAGMWRTKSTKRKLTIIVETFLPVPRAAWQELDVEAERVAQVRGAADVSVVRGG
jgi:hypothetical protein